MTKNYSLKLVLGKGHAINGASLERSLYILLELLRVVSHHSSGLVVKRIVGFRSLEQKEKADGDHVHCVDCGPVLP